ncbi:MAG: hypothetical protein SNJ57_08845 [Cyanobacteriota bacterium]
MVLTIFTLFKHSLRLNFLHECCFEGVNRGAVPPRHDSRKKSIGDFGLPIQERCEIVFLPTEPFSRSKTQNPKSKTQNSHG